VKAFKITAPGQTAVSEVDPPKLGPGEALLRVRRVGLCGTDLNSYRGRNPLVSYPRIPGHEIAATIEQVPDSAPEPLRAGMNVTVLPYTNCGRCPSCRVGRPNACRDNQTLGVQRDGALTELIAVRWEKLFPCMELSLEELALVEPLTVGFHAVDRGQVRGGQAVVVLGCGAIGLGAVAGAAFAGARVIAVDIDQAKLAIAAKAGAAETVNSTRQDLAQTVSKLTGGDGPDVVIEAIGLAETFRAAVEIVAFAGRVVYIGYAKQPVAYETKLFVQKELDIRGSRNAMAEDFLRVIKMLRGGSFPTAQLVTRTYPLTEAGRALADWDADPPAFTKILIDLDA